MRISAGGSLSRRRDLGWVPSTEKRKREKEERGREKRKYLVWVMVRETSRLFPLISSYIYWPSSFCWKDDLVHELGAVFNVICLLFLSLALSSVLLPLHPSGRFPKLKSHHSSVLLCIWALSRLLPTELLNKVWISPPCVRGFTSSVHWWLFSWHGEEGLLNGCYDFLLNFSQTV